MLFRTRAGRARVLDAYCPHLGAHLGEGGRVVGETVRCPFHGWQYDGSGKCVGIPYCKRIPPRARACARGRCASATGMIFVWHHAEGKPPCWEVPEHARARRPGLDASRASSSWRCRCTCRTCTRTTATRCTSSSCTGTLQVPRAEVSYAEGGRFMRVSSRHETRDAVRHLRRRRSIATRWGLGLAAVRTDGHPGRRPPDVLVDEPDRHAAHALALALHRHARTWPTWPARSSSTASRRGVQQDMPHLGEQDPPRRIRCCARPTRYLAEFRKWVRQFYRDAGAEGEDAMDRYLVISSDCHAGLPPERYRDYVDPQYRDAFDVALPIQLADDARRPARSSSSPTSTRSGARGASGRSRAPGTTTSACACSTATASPAR